MKEVKGDWSKSVQNRRHFPGYLLILFLVGTWIPNVTGNRPPQFVLSQGQSEIVLRLKEGKETPVGTLIHRLKGFDYDEDPLLFGIMGQTGNDLLRIENLGTDEANIYLKKELDRETQDSYTLILTLTDGHLGGGSFVTQSLLILVEDVNDNIPICRTENSSVKVEENGDVPLVLTTLECTDLDEGPYGQVIYKLETDPGDEELFNLHQTKDGKGILKLLQPLDYDRKFLYQLRVIAMDRSNTGQVNTAINPILVEVIDKEDRPPEWLMVPSVTRIPEDVSKGSFVLQVRAIDGDRGVNNPIVYSLLNENDLFGIDRDSGIVFTKGTLDREDEHSGGSYILQILATEKTKSKGKSLSVSTEVTVLLMDINDETPRFAARNYVAEVVENQPVDVPVTFLGNSLAECFDHDLGVNGTFRLYTEGDGGVFEITPSQGINQVSFLVRVKNPSRLDYERLKVINFTLVAEEVGKEKKKSKVGMTVFLRDANDNSPRFEKEIYKVSINENAPPGTTVVQIQAQDDDSGLMGTDGIRYTSLTGSIADELILNPITGVVTVGSSTGDKNSLDRELSSSYFLTAEARDSGGRGNRNTVQIQVMINDVNDERPTFLLSRYEGRVFENELQFITPLILEAKDKDLPNTKNSEIHYSIVGGNQDECFDVNRTSGVISLRKALDFEVLPTIPGHPESNVKKVNLTVRASDLGIPPLSTVVPVAIWVLDKNDFSPEFKKRIYAKSIREDTSGGTEILTVEAADSDASHPFNRVFYRMEGGAGDKFNVDSETGVVSLSASTALDFNLHPSYMLHIFAIDGGGLKSSSPALVNITILDVNNKAPQFIVNSSDGVYHAKVRENSPKGTYIMQVRGLDPDEKPILRYRVDFNKSEGRSQDGRIVKGLPLHTIFNLDGTDGILRIGTGKLDRETVEFVRLTIEVEDKGSENGKQVDVSQILIQVLDEQDNEPIFRKSIYSSSLLENSKAGTLVTTVVADDADLDTHVRYALIPLTSDPDKADFPLRIDSETGAITIALPKKIDREARQWLNFTVVAEDAGNGRSTRGVGKADVFVRILDQNDNSPVFLPGEDHLEVVENAKIGTVIGRVEARDVDEGANGRVSYVLDRTSSLGKFSIDPETGQIRIAGPLDREEMPNFLLVVQAYDNWYGYPSSDSHSSFKNVQVTVLDVNDSPPVFDRTDEEFQVSEFYEGIIGTIRATDADAPDSPNSWIQFKIQEGNELGLFKLEPGKNQVKLLPGRSLKGFYGNYTLVILAEDGGKPPNSATKPFHVQISDFNDNSPQFITSQNLTVSVPENATIGSTVVQMRAIDSDTGLNGVVRYRFKKDATAHSDSFKIDPTTGLITLARPLDRRKLKIYHIRVEAYDLGQISLSSELDLRIKVEKMTEFLPIFSTSTHRISFSENQESGDERADLPETVGDETDDEIPVICYFILPDDQNTASIFQLEPFEHWITPKVTLDREQKANYTFTVAATTDCEGKRFRNSPGSTLRVTVDVNDQNDNSPKFDKKVFSGGISTSSTFGSVVLDLSATDLDAPNSPNSNLTYFLFPPIRMSLTEGLSHLSANQSELFLVNGRSVLLNFDPQPDMKGFFTLDVGVQDGDALNDKAVALIYLLREDQKVKVVVRRNPGEVRTHVDRFLRTLGNITGARVNADMSSFRFHENTDGTVDRTKTDFFIHFVQPEKNIVLEVAEVLRLIDLNIEELDDLFKEFNVIDTQGSTLSPRRSKGLSGEGRSLFMVYASGTAAFLSVLLLVVISIACAQRSKYQRRLKAATANAYGSSSTILPRNGNVPNTNVHSGEGSNPIWMQAYQNNWYKEDTHSLSGNSESRDSLEDNGMGSSPPSSHMRSFLGSDEGSHGGQKRDPRRKGHHGHVYHKNILYNRGPLDTNSTCLILKKHLETTEL